MDPLYSSSYKSSEILHEGNPLAPPIDPTAILADLRQKTNCKETPPAYDKNYRFHNIVCIEGTRVQLPISHDGFYLHANHVTVENGKFIATQYPLVEQIPLFWQAAKQTSLIVDLTNEKDMKEGLEPYYPMAGKQINFQGLTIGCTSKQTFKDIDTPIYTYSITIGDDVYQIPRLHFTEWNDHEGITEDQLDQLLAVMEYYQKNSSKSILIHCKAGVGRTGTLIVAAALQNLMSREKVKESDLLDHLYRLILEGREQRGPQFVQSEQQIVTLWNWGWRALQRQSIQSELVVEHLEKTAIEAQAAKYQSDGTVNPEWIANNSYASWIDLGIENYEMLIEYLKKHGPVFKHKTLDLREFDLDHNQFMEVLQLCEAF